MQVQVILHQEPDTGLFVALVPELDVVSQGATEDEAMTNIREAVELFLECASPSEITDRRRRARLLDVA